MRTISLIIVLMASLSSVLFAQDCNNPLLTIYGFTNLGIPQPGAGLQYCQNLQIGQTCCSPETVSFFQARADALVDRMNNLAAAKDLYIAQLRDRYYERFNDLLEGVNDRGTELQQIRAVNPTIADQIQADIDAATLASNDASNINNQFDGALSNYQVARTSCLTTALQVQTSSWCLACDANYGTQGVAADGTVTFSDGLCQAISDACVPLFTTDEVFNPLIRARQIYWRLATVSLYLTAYSTTNQALPYVVSPDPYNPLPSQQPVTVPPEYFAGAEETTGAADCTNLWSQDPLLAQLLTIGGPVPTIPSLVNDNNNDDINTENVVVVDNDSEDQLIVLDNDNDLSARLLQDILAGPEGIWAPDYLGTGLNFGGLRLDPGDYFGVVETFDSSNEDLLIDQDENVNLDDVDDDDDGNNVVVVRNNP